MPFIGVDLGTSFIKGAVLDLDRLQLQHVHRSPFPRPLPGRPPLHREFDPLEIVAAARELLARLAPLAGPVEGIVMCSQMHGLVLTTERGEPRSNVTTWQDQRVLEPADEDGTTWFDHLARQITAEEVRQLGNELRPGLPIGVLYWQRRHGQLPSADLYLASLPDFVFSYLCQTPPLIEPSNAMAHGALNLETMPWHKAVLDRLGLAGLRWPIICPSGTIVGHWRWRGRSVPCYAPVGDYQCALAGALLQPDELSLNISTGSQVSRLRPAAEFGDYQTRPFFDGQFLATITHIPAGRALNALLRLFTELAEAQGVTLNDPWGYVAQAAACVGPTRLRANIAFFTSPCGDRGALTEMREEEMTIGHVFRAAFENMTDNYWASALHLSPTQEWRRLVFSGGLVQRLPPLRQLICERFACEHRLCPTAEDTLLGLLALALTFAGRAPSVTSAMAVLLARAAEGAPLEA